MVISTEVKRKMDATGRISIPAKYKDMIIKDDNDKVELKLVADGSSTYLAVEVNLSEDYINNLKDFMFNNSSSLKNNILKNLVILYI